MASGIEKTFLAVLKGEIYASVITHHKGVVLIIECAEESSVSKRECSGRVLSRSLCTPKQGAHHCLVYIVEKGVIDKLGLAYHYLYLALLAGTCRYGHLDFLVRNRNDSCPLLSLKVSVNEIDFHGSCVSPEILSCKSHFSSIAS